MSDDISKKIQAIMNNPEAMNMISSLMNSGTDTDEPENSQPDSSDFEFAAGIQNVVSSLQNGSDKRINLLRALKPYMRETRASNIDKAIKMLRLSQLSSVLKDI